MPPSLVLFGSDSAHLWPPMSVLSSAVFRLDDKQPRAEARKRVEGRVFFGSCGPRLGLQRPQGNPGSEISA
eukprot:2784781-Pyramimonas_sp.AAC.1